MKLMEKIAIGFGICVVVFVMTVLIRAIVAIECSPFKVGDCAVSGDYKVFRIDQIGTKGGLIVTDIQGEKHYRHALSGGLTSTDCFDLFKDIK